MSSECTSKGKTKQQMSFKKISIIALIILTILGAVFFAGKYQEDLFPDDLGKLKEGIERGNEDLVLQAIHEGANVDLEINYKPALSYAAELGKEKVVKLLLEQGAKVNLEDKEGKTALFYSDRKTIAEILLEYDANVNHKDLKGRSTLMINNSSGVIDALIASESIMLDDTDIQGRTALIYAIKEENYRKVRSLLEKNSNPELTDRNGKSAIDYARACEDKNIRELFIQLESAIQAGKAEQQAQKEANDDELINLRVKQVLDEEKRKRQNAIRTDELLSDGFVLDPKGKSVFRSNELEYRVYQPVEISPETQYLLLLATNSNKFKDEDRIVATKIAKLGDILSDVKIQESLEEILSDFEDAGLETRGEPDSGDGFNLFLTSIEQAEKWVRNKNYTPNTYNKVFRNRYRIKSRISNGERNYKGDVLPDKFAICLENRSLMNKTQIDIQLVAVWNVNEGGIHNPPKPLPEPKPNLSPNKADILSPPKAPKPFEKIVFKDGYKYSLFEEKSLLKGYYVQVYSDPIFDFTFKKAKEYSSHGYEKKVYLFKEKVRGTQHYKIIYGGFSNKKEAEKFRDKLRGRDWPEKEKIHIGSAFILYRK